MRLLINNNNVCSLYDLRNSIDGAVVEDADVKLTIYDSTDTPVFGTPWPKDMRHIENGHYRATIASNIALERGRHYVAKITATDIDGRKGEWELQLTAEPQKVY